MNTDIITVEKPLLSRLEMEDAIERLYAAGIVNQRQVVDLIDDLTPADVSRQEVAFNVALVANEGLGLSGRMPTKSLLKATVDNPYKSDNVSSERQVPRSFLASAARQLVAITCYFTAIYAVGLIILASEVGPCSSPAVGRQNVCRKIFGGRAYRSLDSTIYRSFNIMNKPEKYSQEIEETLD